MSDNPINVTGMATITPKGIRFRNLYYSCPRAISERWFEIAKISGGWNIKILYNPVNFKLIFLETKNEDEMERCDLIEHHMYQNSKLEKYFLSIQKLKRKRRQYQKSEKDNCGCRKINGNISKDFESQ
ncbi:hypothetical protein M6D81_13640 [Paenibacillus sp. J5C_2022]|uniref:hypothetical protein n=1 Tax=Paenibacillus sp. J5C2022 TaxID=2977129 RepID=UPI0021CDEFB5|nr:hypothetical protein [Paenibacillus sp. J5C2022]MCU6709740.1 hypothetical protein [Paenibacillus sp. J5C2022]